MSEHPAAAAANAAQAAVGFAIDIVCEDGCEPYPQWNESDTRALAEFLLSELRMAAGSDISVAFVGEVEMERLHIQWLDEPGPTDVMSFPMDELVPGDERVGSLGDVVLCGTVAARQAEAAGHSVRDEVELLFTHGVLHLLGHDHQEPDEHEVMFGLQAHLLALWREEKSR
mgnify:CR=1 FL=1